MADELREFTAKDVAEHKDSSDAWMVIHGKVYDVSEYINDHPGGSDVLVEVAGSDATEAFDDAGHSDDTQEIMAEFLVGKIREADKKPAAKPVKVVTPTAAPAQEDSSRIASTAVKAMCVTLGIIGVHFAISRHGGIKLLSPSSLPSLPSLLSPRPSIPRGAATFGFAEGFLAASTVFVVAGGLVSKRLMKLMDFENSALEHPPHIKLSPQVKTDPLLQRGWLDPAAYQTLPLTTKELIAPNTYRFVFDLPTPDTVLGLPIGQHVAITATVDGKSVTRSYTPTSNNADVGKLDLVIKCYPDGLLTGRYLANLKVGDEVQFRGPKGAMRYRPGLCKKIGMLAGGTGITPMYQLIRAICEDDSDTTEVSLIYANRTEDDILLRRELEAFARRYPANFRLYYSLDSPPAGWQFGCGFVTGEMMAERFPAPGADAKVMICGPPGMVNAAKGALVGLGFEQPAASSKMDDQIFCF